MTDAVQPAMCATCPFREGSEYAYLRDHLAEASMVTSRYCHSTGTNALGRTGRKVKVCRGSRDIQLKAMFAAGVIAAPTDEAWGVMKLTRRRG